MIEGAHQLSLAFVGSEGSSTERLDSRMEMRQRTVRRVEYTPFPRAGSDTRARVGFTRDVSTAGMCLGVEETLPVGALLRVIVHKVDGRPDFDAVARVTWCREEPDGSAGAPAGWLGLVLVAEVQRGMARIPRTAAAPARRTA